MSFLNQWDLSLYQQAKAFTNFHPTDQLDLGLARDLMWAAQLAYELDIQTSEKSVNKVKQVLGFWGLQFIQTVPTVGFPQVPPAARALFLSVAARDALVIGAPGAIIVSFAGTDPPRLQDWIVNFAAGPSASGVSEGLAEAAAALAPPLKPVLDQQPGLDLFITGHSLGGSLGVAVAYELSKLGRTAKAVYTYGMPRAGNPAFASDYDARLGNSTFRFVHGNDLVPTVPPAQRLQQLIGLHQHVGWFIHCERGGKFALAQKSATRTTNDPIRDDEIESGVLETAGIFGRTRAAFDALVSGDAAGTFIALAPDRIRQHLQDQYIAALTP
jgi:hypothetical protein